MKNLIPLFILIGFFSYKPSNAQESEAESGANLNKYDIMCQCIDSVELINDDKELDNLVMKCIYPVSGLDESEYVKALHHILYYCPKFVVLKNELELLKRQIDTIPFEPATSQQCLEISKGKWKDVISMPGVYSIRKDSVIENYEDYKLTSVWKLIDHKDCIATYIVKEKNEDVPLPPLKGDIIKIETKGTYNNMIIGEISFGELRVRTVSIRDQSE